MLDHYDSFNTELKVENVNNIQSLRNSKDNLMNVMKFILMKKHKKRQILKKEFQRTLIGVNTGVDKI